MIDPAWRRIAGMHLCNDGDLAVVWVAHDKLADVVHIYDACRFAREVFAVIAEGINARGRWIPIAWASSAADMAEKLRERGLSPTIDGYKDTDPMAEVASRDILERMKSGRLKVERRLKEWVEEFETFSRDENKIPRDSHPMMAATRHAVANLQLARRQASSRKNAQIYQQIAMV